MSGGQWSPSVELASAAVLAVKVTEKCCFRTEYQILPLVHLGLFLSQINLGLDPGIELGPPPPSKESFWRACCEGKDRQSPTVGPGQDFQ